MKLKAIAGLLAVVAGVLALYAGDVLASGTGVTTTILAKSVFEPIHISGHANDPRWRARVRTHGLTDVYVVDNKIAPGGDTGWHSHPGPSMILVVAGTVTNYMGDDPACTPHVYTAGQGFVDPGGKDVHILRNEGTDVAETIAVQYLQQGAVRKTDVAEPGVCHFAQP